MSDLIEKVTPLLAQLKNPEVERLLLDLAHKIEAKDQRILELTAMSQAGNVDELLRRIEQLEEYCNMYAQMTGVNLNIGNKNED